MEKNKKFPAELRKDIVSGNWVVISKIRKNRPQPTENKKEIVISKKDCVFCNIKTQEKPLLIYNKSGDFSSSGIITDNWSFISIPNKFPILSLGSDLEKREEGEGLYKSMNGVGHCELILGRDHDKNIFDLNKKEVEIIITIFQKRYLELMKDPFVNYVSIFQNYGLRAGASQPHPHFQIMTTPLIDISLTESIRNSKKYFEENKKCVYCEMIKWDKKNKKRVVYENEHFIAICPFASQVAFQVVISPKKHLSNFEKITEEEKISLADIFIVVFKSLNKTLSKPSYNLYLHTSPCDGNDHSYYHWHWSIMPRTTTWAGFELGTRIEVSSTEPEEAAKYLRNYL